MSLDHGLLNIPLAKRGDIDAQLDKFKSKQASDAKAARKARAAEMAALRVKAKGLVANADAGLLQRVAERSGRTVATVKRILNSDAHWRPEFVIRVLGEQA